MKNAKWLILLASFTPFLLLGMEQDNGRAIPQNQDLVALLPQEILFKEILMRTVQLNQIGALRIESNLKDAISFLSTCKTLKAMLPDFLVFLDTQKIKCINLYYNEQNCKPEDDFKIALERGWIHWPKKFAKNVQKNELQKLLELILGSFRSNDLSLQVAKLHINFARKNKTELESEFIEKVKRLTKVHYSQCTFIEYLISQGININCPMSSFYNMSPLTYAIQILEDNELAKILADSGAVINNENKETEYPKVVQFLENYEKNKK